MSHRPGVYATEINIYNSHNVETRIRKHVGPVMLAGVATAERGNRRLQVGKEESRMLAPGSYGNVMVRGELSLSGGLYQFRSMKIRAGGRVVIEDASEIRIQKQLKMGRGTFLGAAAGVEAREIIVYVGEKVWVKSKSTVEANLYAEGKIRFRSEVNARGSFISETKFKSGKNGVYDEDSAHHSFGL